MNPSHGPRPARPSPLQVFGSVAAAAFGVQSSKNRERDFSQGSPRHYVVAGLIFTLLFIVILVGVVKLVLL